MTFGTLGDLNWLAVIVAAVVYFALGAVWYTAKVLGTRWMKSIGWDPSAQDAPQMSGADYVVPFIGYVVITIAVGMLVVATGTDTFSEGIVLGLVLGVLFAGSLFYVTAKFEPTKPAPMSWFAITGSYHALGILISAVIVALW